MWDLNADLGELEGSLGAEVDAALLTVVTSANVACGGHAGDAVSMRRVCVAAAESGVAVGAQVSYVDREGFGRRHVDVSAATLIAQLTDQLAALDEHARAAGTAVTYVKPHGALYHAAATEHRVAAAVVASVAAYDERLPLLTLPGSALAAAARERGMHAVGEAFADRAYTREGRLLPRTHHASVVTDRHEVVLRVLRLTSERAVRTVDGADVRVDARSVCLHGDTPGAVDLARAIHTALTAAGVALEAFAPPPARRP